MTGFILLSIGFLFMPAKLTCRDIEDPAQCEDWVCSKPEEEWEEYEESVRVHSLLMEYGQYHCQYAGWASTYRAILFSGILVGYVTFTHISDNLGRRKAILATWGTNCLGLFLLVVSYKMSWACFGLFLAGAGCETSLRISLAMINEVVDSSRRQNYSLLLQCCYCSAGLGVSVGYYTLIEWRSVTFLFCLVPSIAIMVITILYL